MLIPLKSTTELLELYKNYVVQQSRANLSRLKKKNTLKLYRSIEGEVLTEKNYSIVGFTMEEYGWYQDQGVKGVNGKFQTHNDYKKEGFAFGKKRGPKGGLTKGIEKWVIQKGIQFRDKKSGRYLTYKSTAFIITRSIYQKGLKPSLFFTKPFLRGYQKYIETDLMKSYAQDVETLIGYKLKQIK
jgi:hypothetical protein